jgi:plastocyanin
VIVPLAIAAALVAAAPAAAPKPRTVEIADNYYAPAKLTVRKDTKVVWRWPEEAGDVHDVKLAKRPKGVKRFHSEPASAGFSFKRKLARAGTYRIVCTLHEEMTMTITVRPG